MFSLAFSIWLNTVLTILGIIPYISGLEILGPVIVWDLPDEVYP